MAGTILVPVGVSGYSLTARLYPITSDTLSDSYTLTEYSTRRGLYSAAVSGALSGDFYCNCVTANGDIIFTGFTSLSLTSGNFIVGDYEWNPHFGLSTSDPLNVNVVQWSGVNVIPATIQGMPSVNVEYVGGILQQITNYLDSKVSELPSGVLYYNIPEPTGVFAWEANLSKIAAWLGALSRNKITQTESTQTLFNDSSVDIASSTTSDDGTTFTRERRMAISTRNHRTSAINIFLPFGRIYFLPDGDLNDEQDRKHMTFSYRFLFLTIPYIFFTLMSRSRNWILNIRERNYEL